MASMEPFAKGTPEKARTPTTEPPKATIKIDTATLDEPEHSPLPHAFTEPSARSSLMKPDEPSASKLMVVATVSTLSVAKTRKIPTCKHPDRSVYARGLCGPCYQSARLHGKFLTGIKKTSVDSLGGHSRKSAPLCEHPERIHYAKNLCHQCYMKKWRRRHSKNERPRQNAPSLSTISPPATWTTVANAHPGVLPHGTLVAFSDLGMQTQSFNQNQGGMVHPEFQQGMVHPEFQQGMAHPEYQQGIPHPEFQQGMIGGGGAQYPLIMSSMGYHQQQQMAARYVLAPNNPPGVNPNHGSMWMPQMASMGGVGPQYNMHFEQQQHADMSKPVPPCTATNQKAQANGMLQPENGQLEPAAAAANGQPPDPLAHLAELCSSA